MSALGAAVRGLGKVLSSPSLVGWLWLASIVFALPAAAMVSWSLEDSLGASLFDEKLREGFDMGWYGEYQAEAKGVERTFTPTLVGAGAFFANIDSWFNGSLFEVPPVLLGLGGLYVLFWALCLGGVLHRYGEPGGIFRLPEFVSHGGEYFLRFVRLGVLAGFFYYAVYRFAGWLFGRIETATLDETSEETVLAYVVAAGLLVVFLLSFVNMAFDYAKIATFRENRRSMVLACVKGFGFVLSNLGRTTTLYLGLGTAGLVMLYAYHLVAPGAGQSTMAAVVVAFLVGQVYLVAKLVLRLTFYAGQMVVFDDTQRL